MCKILHFLNLYHAKTNLLRVYINQESPYLCRFHKIINIDNVLRCVKKL